MRGTLRKNGFKWGKFAEIMGFTTNLVKFGEKIYNPLELLSPLLQTSVDFG